MGEMLTELILFVAVLSLDAFTASVAYGTEKIKIGYLPAFIISLTGGLALLISALFSSFLSGFLSEAFCRTLGFIVLFWWACSILSKERLKAPSAGSVNTAPTCIFGCVNWTFL